MSTLCLDTQQPLDFQNDGQSDGRKSVLRGNNHRIPLYKLRIVEDRLTTNVMSSQHFEVIAFSLDSGEFKQRTGKLKY
jgi:hypothetical protein